MKFNTDKLTLGNNNGVQGVFIQIPLNLLDKLKKIVDKEGMKSVEIKSKRKVRSQSANAYSWVLIDKLAKMLTIPKGDMYIKMIKNYGKCIGMEVKAEAVQELINKWNKANTEVEHFESLCEITRGFTDGRVKKLELNCYFGTSTYDNIEFNYYLQGIVSECKMMGIETMTPREIKTMMEGYDKK